MKGRVGGDNYNTAIVAGLFEVTAREDVGVIEEVDRWLESLETAASEHEAPPLHDGTAERSTRPSSICVSTGDPKRLSGVIARRPCRRASQNARSGHSRRPSPKGHSAPANQTPLGGLSPRWITACDDQSPEFRLASSLAFLSSLRYRSKTGPIRRYLEPVKWEKANWHWGERGGHVAPWSGGDLDRNLGTVLTRRVMDAKRSGERPLPLSSPFPATPADVAAFLTGRTDDQKLENLLWGLMLIDPRDAVTPQWHADDNFILPSAYALLKLTLLPGGLEWIKFDGKTVLSLKSPDGGEAPTGITVKPDSAIFAKLRAGDVRAGCEIAVRRLRASGFVPIASRLGDGSRRNIDWSANKVPPFARLPSLVFPNSSRS